MSIYLDDFLFLAATLHACNYLISTFLDLCEKINCPVSEEKTVCGAQLIVFLGILLDGRNYLLALPADKCSKAKKMLQWIVGKKSATVTELQKLTGTLNFLTKAIFAGMVFTRRMYTKCSNVSTQTGKLLKHYHHVKLDNEFKNDCMVWIKFLESAEAKKMLLCRPFVDLFAFETSVILPFYSDAAKKDTLGFGVYYNKQWTYGAWEPGYIENIDPSIEYLELFALCVGIFTWQEQLRDCRIIIYCDNQAVVSMVNNTTSSCKNCMVLLRLLVLNGLIYNRRVLVCYIKLKENFLADSLS